MDKKEYVLKALELIKDKWELAEGRITLIKQTDIDEAILDLIIKTIDTSIKQTKDLDNKKKLTGLKEYLEKIKEAEHISQEQDKSALAELDRLLENM